MFETTNLMTEIEELLSSRPKYDVDLPTGSSQDTDCRTFVVAVKNMNKGHEPHIFPFLFHQMQEH